MRIRQGFVSNSSSSSFLLATKGEVTQERLLGLFGVSKDSFLYSFAEEIAAFFSDVGGMEKFETVEELRQYHDWGSEERFRERYAQEITLIENGWLIYNGSASDEAYDGVERWICNQRISFESDDLILETEGGY